MTAHLGIELQIQGLDECRSETAFMVYLCGPWNSARARLQTICRDCLIGAADGPIWVILM